MSGTVNGAAEAQRRLEQLAKEFPKEVGRALYQQALVIEKESKKRCPVDARGGTLRASIETTKPIYGADGEISVTIEAGGPSAPYAMAVHEHESEHSPPSWEGIGPDEINWTQPGSGVKFIEGPILEAVPTLAESLVERIDLGRASR